MTKIDLLDALGAAGFSRKQAHAAASLLISEIEGALLRGEEVRLRGLGTFYIKDLPGRRLKSLQTGEEYEVPPRKGVRFRPSLRVREAVRSLRVEKP